MGGYRLCNALPALLAFLANADLAKDWELSVKNINTMTARDLVADMRRILTDRNGLGELPSYTRWEAVRARILECLWVDDLKPEHLAALGASMDIDPMSECGTTNALVTFCKSVKLEADKNLREADA